MKIKAKHLLIGGGILASIIALTTMSNSASSTASNAGNGSGSGNNQRTGEENSGLTNSSLEDKIKSDANLQLKLDIARTSAELEILRGQEDELHEKTKSAEKGPAQAYNQIRAMWLAKKDERIMKESEHNFLKSLL